jgi:hypothetical protein
LWSFRENKEGWPLLLPADTKRHMLGWLVPAAPPAAAAQEPAFKCQQELQQHGKCCC